MSRWRSLLCYPMEKNHRYKNAPSLYFMEQNLFRPYYHKWRQKEDELRIVSLKNPREELHFVAREITKFVREKQYCYKDIAVVTGDVSLYDNYVDEIFAAYDIPYFLDQTRTILFHPFIEFIRAVLEVVELDFSYESVFRFSALRSDRYHRAADRSAGKLCACQRDTRQKKMGKTVDVCVR